MVFYQDMTLEEKVKWLEADCRRMSQLITHGRLDDESCLWPRPIPVSERLPDGDFKTVLAFDVENDDWTEARFYDGKWYAPYPWQNFGNHCQDADRLEGVTHWIPLPPKPE